MKKEVTKTIDGNEYIFYQMPINNGLEVLFELLKIIAEPVGVIGGSSEKLDVTNLLNIEIKSDSLGTALKALASNMDSKNTIELINKLFKYVKHQGQALSEILDPHFTGRYLSLFKVLFAVLEVQFGNFFGDIPAIKEKIQAVINPKTST